MKTRCPACGGGELLEFFAADDVPVFCNVPAASAEEARGAPRGNIRLAWCRSCTHVFNRDFRPELLRYGSAYENSLHFSAMFREYAEGLARELVERHGLYGRTIVEIGCGQGDFLGALCALGGNRGLGFDPAYDPGRPGVPPVEDLSCYPELFSGAALARVRLPGEPAPGFDFLCCRQVLEHLDDPRELLLTVSAAAGSGDTGSSAAGPGGPAAARPPGIFFEVPDALFTLRGIGLWDIIYEHPSYFTAGSLRRLFASTGFRVLRVDSRYGGQFLTVEAVPDGREEEWKSAAGDPGEAEESRRIGELVERFALRHRRAWAAWQRWMERGRREGRRVVIWGAGSKGVTFLNGPGRAGAVRYVVDVNPHKEGRFLAGAGQEIVSPEFLRDYRPEAIVVMNRIYAGEVRARLRELGPAGAARLLFAS